MPCRSSPGRTQEALEGLSPAERVEHERACLCERLRHLPQPGQRQASKGVQPHVMYEAHVRGPLKAAKSLLVLAETLHGVQAVPMSLADTMTPEELSRELSRDVHD